MADQAKEKMVRRVGVVDISSAIEERARELAEQSLTAEKESLTGVSGFLTRIWKHNLAREYYRQTEIAAARQRILGREDVVNAEGSRAAHEKACGAIVDRFLSEYEETLHEGEVREKMGEKTPALEVREKFRILVQDYAGGHVDEATFESRKKSILASFNAAAPNVGGEARMFADNLLEVAKEVKTVVQHGRSLSSIDLDIEVTAGKARLGARTETEFSRVDAVMAKLAKWNVPFQDLAVRGLGAMSSMAALPGVFLGGEEKRRMLADRKLHLREAAAGHTFNSDKDKRRAELESTIYTQRSALELTNDLLDLEGGPIYEEDSPEAFVNLLQALAEVEARVQVSDSRKVDLIRYSDPLELEAERLALDLARARAKQELRASFGRVKTQPGLWTPDQMTLLAEDDFNVLLDKQIRARATEFTDPQLGEIAQKNRLAFKLKGRQSFLARQPLEPARPPVRQIEAVPSVSSTATTIESLPTPARVLPVGSVDEVNWDPDEDTAEVTDKNVIVAPNEPEEEIDLAGTESEDEPAIEPEVTVETAPYAASLERFNRWSGLDWTVGEVREKYSELLVDGEFDKFTRLFEATGVAPDRVTLTEFAENRDVASLSKLLSISPELPVNLPWKDSLIVAAKRIDHGDHRNIDPWTQVNGMLESAKSKELLDSSNPADGRLVLDYMSDIGPVHAPLTLEHYLELKRNAKWESIVLMKTERDAMIYGFLEGKPVDAPKDERGFELYKALENRAKNILENGELQKKVSQVKTLAEYGAVKSYEDFGKLLKLKYDEAQAVLEKEVDALERKLKVEKSEFTKPGLERRLREKKAAVEAFVKIFPGDDTADGWKKYLTDLCSSGAEGKEVDTMIRLTFAREAGKDDEIGAAMKSIAENDQITTEKSVREYNSLLLDKMIGTYLPQRVLANEAGAQKVYHRTLKAFEAHDPSRHPLAIGVKRLDEWHRMTSHEQAAIKALSAEERPRLLRARAEHQLKDVEELLTVTSIEVAKWAPHFEQLGPEARMLIGLASMSAAVSREAFGEKKYVLAEKKAQEALRYIGQVKAMINPPSPPEAAKSAPATKAEPEPDVAILEDDDEPEEEVEFATMPSEDEEEEAENQTATATPATGTEEVAVLEDDDEE